MSSLAAHLVDGCRRHPEAAGFVSSFRSRRLQLARRLFDMVNSEVFDSQVRPRAGRGGGGSGEPAGCGREGVAANDVSRSSQRQRSHGLKGDIACCPVLPGARMAP